MARRNRPARPGEQPTVPSSQGNGGANHPNNPNRPKRRKRRQGAGADPVDEADPAINDSTRSTIIRDDPEGYMSTLLGRAGLVPTVPDTFSDMVYQAAMDWAMRAYDEQVMNQDSNITFEQFADRTFGTPSSITPSQRTVGTGMPVNTGNPYTSSSGIGTSAPTGVGVQINQSGNVAPSMQSYLQQQGINKPKGGFNQKRRNKLNEQYNAFLNTPAGGAQPAPPAGPPSPTKSLDDFRIEVMGKAPELRGHNYAGVINTPARWSAWG